MKCYLHLYRTFLSPQEFPSASSKSVMPLPPNLHLDFCLHILVLSSLSFMLMELYSIISLWDSLLMFRVTLVHFFFLFCCAVLVCVIIWLLFCWCYICVSNICILCVLKTTVDILVNVLVNTCMCFCQLWNVWIIR